MLSKFSPAAFEGDSSIAIVPKHDSTGFQGAEETGRRCPGLARCCPNQSAKKLTWTRVSTLFSLILQLTIRLFGGISTQICAGKAYSYSDEEECGARKRNCRQGLR